jgi:GWxTD domain-containing protein
LNKSISQVDYINLDNSSPQSGQNFFLHLSSSVNPLFADYLSSNDTFSVDFRSESSRKIFVNYYRRSFAMAAPPNSYDMRDPFNYKPDSIFTIMSGTNKYVFEKEGMYHLQLDTTDKEGETIYRFGKGFPAVATPEALLNPLYYIVTKKEFTELNNSPNKKKAIDKLWLDMGGSTERSRDLIKKYYSRVEKANRLFTSYMEGWHTDRGMIYIVFGVPHDVYKSSTGESWTYGESNSALSITFNFTKATNPFSDNDFVLSRDPVYETMWYRAMDTWREGRAFNDY